MDFPCHRFRLLALLFSALLAASLPAAATAQEKEIPQLSEKTRELIQTQYRPAVEVKNWDLALEHINGAIPRADPNSYDAALLYQIKGDLHFQKEQLSEASAAYERSLQISDRNNIFAPRVRNDLVFRIFSFTFIQAATSKDDPKAKLDGFAKAEGYLNDWLKTDPHLNEQIVETITQLYVNYALAKGDNESADAALIQKTLKWADIGLRMSVKPRDSFYNIKVLCLFQLNRIPELVDLLELLVERKPDNRTYWQQLYYNYLLLASQVQEKDDKRAAYAYYTRALLTIERAQQHGFFDTPKDNFGLVSIYFTINELKLPVNLYYQACGMLDKGLRAGTIESTENNWKLLAFSYREIQRDKLAIDALLEAAKVFPESGQLEYEIALIYWSHEQLDKAFEHSKACIAKGSTEKPGAGWYFYAMLAYELKHYEEAAKAAEEAGKYPENATFVKQLKAAIEASLEERENELNRAQNNL